MAWLCDVNQGRSFSRALRQPATCATDRAEPCAQTGSLVVRTRLVLTVPGSFELEGGVLDVEVIREAELEAVEHGRSRSVSKARVRDDHVRRQT